MATRVRTVEVGIGRINLIFGIIAVIYLLLIGRLVYLQAIKGEYYRSWAAKTRTQHIKLRAERGGIYDRDGKPLAVTTHRGVLIADPGIIKNKQLTAMKLASILGMPPEQILPLLAVRMNSNHRPDRRVEICKKMNTAQVDAWIKAHQVKGKDGAALRKALQGVKLDDVTERAYPSGQEAVHVIGTMVVDDAGLICGKGLPEDHGKIVGGSGLEHSKNSVLSGADGRVSAEMDSVRRVIPGTENEHIPASDGLDVHLTLDSTIQHIAETELAVACAKYHPVGATAIVMDPRTGDVLAMVNWPSYDPITRNGLTRKNVAALCNRAMVPFEPGSTLKIITAAAALNDKVITPQTSFFCPGHVTIGKRSIRCVLHGASQANGHGAETIRDIIKHSCNVGTAEVGVKVGWNRMVDYLDRFGLLSKTQVGLPGDSRGRLSMGNKTVRASISQVSRVAFGQAVMVTPLAMASAYSAIANNGLLMKPRLVQSFTDQDGKVVKKFSPIANGQAISPETAAELCSYLESVVKDGTGKKVAELPGYRVAGKTGTAQKVERGSKVYSSSKFVASFIGFLPVSAPRAVVYVVVDEPNGSIYGAQVAAPVFQAISRRLMWYWNVTPDDPGSLTPNHLSRT